MGLFDNLRRAFRPKPHAPKLPPPPQAPPEAPAAPDPLEDFLAAGLTGEGFRGTATGSEAAREEMLRAGGPTFIPPEEAKWEYVGAEEGRAFLRGERTFPVHSSNVRSARYLPDQQAMIVTFKGKKKADQSYQYLEIPLFLAADFLRSGSKGGWVWTNLRIRGTKNGHRKPFIKL